MEKNPIPINIHGYRSTPQFRDYDSWKSHIEEQLEKISNRITISTFLERDQFVRNKRDNNPEPKRVKDMFDDPLPNGGGISSWKSSKDYSSNQQRREWGFREKILQGYPEYEPDKIGYGDLQGKVIAGFVTVGDGVFSGIPSYANIELDREETRRQIEYGYGRSTGRDMIPTGLSFIQDETSGIGLMLGSDVRYTWHPRLYGTNLSNPSIAMVDDMHMGSICVPKGDYRQFLRVGDFVIIEIGTRLKYWHSLLGGSRPDYWETLVGYREIYDTVPDLIAGNGTNLGREDINLILDGKTAEQVKNEIQLKYGNVYRTIDPPKILGIESQFRDEPPTDSGQAVLDHPWSTGTPIPINSGMPYILMEDYLVDSSNRVSPSPLVITADFLRDMNQTSFDFSGGNNRGAKLKGMLVRINNLYFVESPLKNEKIQRSVVKSDNSPGLYSEKNWIRSGSNSWQPRAYHAYAPELTGTINGQSTSVFISENLKKLNLNIWDHVPSQTWIQKYWPNNTAVNLWNLTGSMPNNQMIVNFPDNLRAWKHEVEPTDGIDFAGNKFEMPITSRRESLMGSKPAIENWRPPETMRRADERQDKDGWLRTLGTNPFGTSDDLIRGGSWQNILWSDDNTWLNSGRQLHTGNTNKESFKARAGLLKYRLESGSVRFPMSIDTDAGGYWFTNRNIPLPNAVESGPNYAQSTWLVSSNKVVEYVNRSTNRIRRVGDLGRGTTLADKTYSAYYEWNNEDPRTNRSGHASENVWKNLPRITGGYFEPNKVYYLQEEKTGIVIPIRINANTEIARFRVPIPTGLVSVTGIAWQYSMGTPGLEWEREQYVMQVWPRFLSDIEPVGGKRDGVILGGEVPLTDEPFTPPDTNEPPTRRRLSDITRRVEPNTPLDPVYLDCERLRVWLDILNNERELYISAANWPVVNSQGQDASGNPLFNTHKDPVTGREITLPRDRRQQQATLESEYPEYPCKGMRVGDERAVIITNSATGVSRTFYFTIGTNGECNCVKMQPGGGVPQTPTNGNVTNFGGNLNGGMDFGGVR